MKKRDLYIETMLREADDKPASPKVDIYYEDFTDDGRVKILQAIEAADENQLLDVFGDDLTKDSIEDSLFGNNGKTKIPVFRLDASKLKSYMEI